MIYLEYVTTLLYNEEDVKTMTFCDIESAREFTIAKQNEMAKGGDTFFLLKFKEVK